MAGDVRLPERTWINAFHLTGRGLDSIADLERWTRAIDSLPVPLQNELRTTADLDRKFLVNCWWLRAARKKSEDEIRSAVERLRRLENWAAGFGDELLAAYAVRGQIILSGEYLHDLDAAVAAGERASAAYRSPSSQFLIQEVVGTQYSVRQEWEKAESWFSRALQNDSAASTSERVDARMRIAQVVGRGDPRLAVIHLERALSDARSSDALPYELPQVLGDLGTARWKAGERAGAVDAWAEAADLLLGGDLDDRNLRGLFMMLHAAVVYPAMQVRIGRPPIVPVSGEPMQEPRIGHFLRELAPEAETWAKRAYTEAETQADYDRLPLMAMELLPLSLLDDDFDDAMRLLDRRILLMPEELLNAIPTNVAGDGAIDLFLFLPFLRVARIALDEPEKTRGILRNVIRTYLTEKFPNVVVRDALTDLSDHTFDEQSSTDLTGLHNREELPAVVSVIARVFHSLDRRRSVVERFTDHCIVAQRFHERSSVWGIGDRWIVLDFFETYWMRELLSNAFRFNRPSDVRAELSRLRHVPDEERLQALLLAVAEGLGATCLSFLGRGYGPNRAATRHHRRDSLCRARAQ